MNALEKSFREMNWDGLKHTLNQLPKDTGVVISLHYLNQIPLKDICEIIGKSISTVRNHHNRGLFLIQKYLDEN